MSQNVSWGKPLALAVTLVVIGTGAYWLEFSHKPKSEEKEEQEKILSADCAQKCGLQHQEQAVQPLCTDLLFPLRPDQEREDDGDQEHKQDIQSVQSHIVADRVRADPGRDFLDG